jgi:hypothetical protein
MVKATIIQQKGEEEDISNHRKVQEQVHKSKKKHEPQKQQTYLGMHQ